MASVGPATLRNRCADLHVSRRSALTALKSKRRYLDVGGAHLFKLLQADFAPSVAAVATHRQPVTVAIEAPRSVEDDEAHAR